MENRFVVLVAFLACLGGFAAGIAFGFSYATPPQSQPTQPTATPSHVISPEDAGKKALDFVSRTFGAKAELINVSEVRNAELYEVSLNISDIRGTHKEKIYITKDGRRAFFGGMLVPERETIGNFLVSGEDVCKEDGKPVVYFFGHSGCPHCLWEHPIFENVTANFTDFISVHDNFDNFTADEEVFSLFSPRGYVPTIVLGCKFYRVGSGENQGEKEEEAKEEEAKVLTALICELTGGKPENVCNAPEIRELRENI